MRTGVIAHTYQHMFKRLYVCVCVALICLHSWPRNPVLLAGSPMISVQSTRQLRDGFMNRRPRVVFVVVAPHSPAQHKATIDNRRANASDGKSINCGAFADSQHFCDIYGQREASGEPICTACRMQHAPLMHAASREQRKA